MKKIILLAICLIGLSSCCSRKKETVNAEQSGIKLKVEDYIFYSFDIVHFNYNGHSYIGFKNNGYFSIVHNPDCKCLKEKEDELYY